MASTLTTPHGSVSVARTGPPDGPVLVLAHGAGGSMSDPLLDGFAEALAEDGVASFRFNFLYRELGRRSPDREPLLREVWSAAFKHASEAGGPAWAGGKSLGGRIGSMMVADGTLPAAGLVFVGYPLHPPGRRERVRDAHLPDIRVPMLFLQGTADPFASWDLLGSTLERLGRRARLHQVEGGDHSFRVRGRPRDDRGMGRELGRIAAAFVLEHR